MEPATTLTSAEEDRATGAVIGMAVGNALGAGYAFEPRPLPQDVELRGGGLGPYAAGEWVDDTAMALPLLQIMADGEDLRTRRAQDQVAARWVAWRETTADVAPLIAEVLGAYDPADGSDSLRQAAAALYSGTRAPLAGNASLMRTTPITLGYLHRPRELAAASRLYSELTHAHPEAGDACVLWNLAQRHAIMCGEFDLTVGLPYIPTERQALWARLITQAEVGPPEDFAVRNSWVTQVLQTAWSAISHSNATRPEHFEQALRVAVACGGDTSTVGAVAGGLLGARWGVSAIPLEWRRKIFGYPGYRDADLQREVYRVVTGREWPTSFHPAAEAVPFVAHPLDGGVILGGVRGLSSLPPAVDAVVSLCRLGWQEDRPAVGETEHVRVWLVDSPHPEDNPNLRLVTADVVDLLSRIRADGRTVYLHCDEGRVRTPYIAAAYGARISDRSAESVFATLSGLLPDVQRNPVFDQALRGYA